MQWLLHHSEGDASEVQSKHHILSGEYLKKIDDKYVVLISYECWMGFGELPKYEIDSGENNKTRGKDPL
jgi:hypothetical protein